LEIYRTRRHEIKEFVATGATDEEVDRWIRENTTQKDPDGYLIEVGQTKAEAFKNA